MKISYLINCMMHIMMRIGLVAIFSGNYIIAQIEYDNSWAVVVGIDDYQNENITDLNYAVSDASDIREMLIDYYEFPPENITMLLNDDATSMNIKRAISGLAKKTSGKDRIVVFYAGHGMTEELPAGGEMGYLVPYDGNLEDLYVSAIPMSDMRNMSDRFDARHVLFLVDACYGGLAAVGTRGLSTKIAGYYDKVFRGKARQIITAGGKGETVIEKADWGHSAFTYNLLRGLKDWMADLDNDGYITGEELGLYLKKRVTEDSDLHQTPTTGRFSTDQGEFMFTRPEQLGGLISSGNDNSPSTTQAELMEVMKENAELVSRLSNRPMKSVSTAKKLSILYPGLGHLYMGEKKNGLLWSAAGTGSLLWTLASFSNYNSKIKSVEETSEAYSTCTDCNLDQFNTLRTTWESAKTNKKTALTQLIISSTVYTSVVVINYLSFRSKKDNYSYSNKINGSVNDLGQLVITFPL